MPTWLWAVAVVGVVAAFVYAAWETPQTVSTQQAPTSSPRAAPVARPVVDPPPDAGFATLVDAGNRSMDAGDYQAAIRMYSRALQLDSTAADVWVDRGACNHSSGDSRAAREDFRSALRLAPEHTVAQFNMGITWYTDGQADSATWWLDRVVRLAPQSREADRARNLLAELSPQGS